MDVDTVKLSAAIRAAATTSGLAVQFVAWDTMRLWMIDMVRRAAPWAGHGKLGGWREQQNCGRGAIATDFSRAFEDSDKVTPFEQNGKFYLRNNESGNVWQQDKSKWLVNVRDYHLQVRNKRGRVPKKTVKAFARKRDILSEMKLVQKRVGELKNGFLPGIMKFASLCNGAVRLPKWITTQTTNYGNGSGSIDKTGNGKIYVENTAPHNEAVRRSACLYSLDLQERTLKKHLSNRIKRIADQFNKGQIPKAGRMLSAA